MKQDQARRMAEEVELPEPENKLKGAYDSIREHQQILKGYQSDRREGITIAVKQQSCVDRSDAVNLAVNMLEHFGCAGITEKGLRTLCEAVLRMDSALSAAAPVKPMPVAKFVCNERNEWKDEVEFLVHQGRAMQDGDLLYQDASPAPGAVQYSLSSVKVPDGMTYRFANGVLIIESGAKPQGE